MRIRFQGCFFYVNDHQVILSHPIYGLIELDDMVLLLIYGTSSKQMENLPANNVYAFDREGRQVWQIQEPLQYDDGFVSYADISLKKDGVIVAGSTKGDEYLVNTDDGTVEHIKNQRAW
jgi:outer membrane protein assembly factor BamB